MDLNFACWNISHSTRLSLSFPLISRFLNAWCVICALVHNAVRLWSCQKKFLKLYKAPLYQYELHGKQNSLPVSTSLLSLLSTSASFHYCPIHAFVRSLLQDTRGPIHLSVCLSLSSGSNQGTALSSRLVWYLVMEGEIVFLAVEEWQVRGEFDDPQPCKLDCQNFTVVSISLWIKANNTASRLHKSAYEIAESARETAS